jgi:hypothetical protein
LLAVDVIQRAKLVRRLSSLCVCVCVCCRRVSKERRSEVCFSVPSLCEGIIRYL